MKGDLAPETKSWLVDEAEKILNRVKDDRDFRGQTAQLRNLVQIAQSESEVPVLRNFIRYQTGRKSTKKFWSLIHAGVLRMLEDIGKAFPDVDKRRKAIQSFFGYLVRHYVYLTA
ncbi:MAG TPA: hypothetical protein VLV54_08690 [Thermoanaerobaculia bacterium]|nr:hypothetical protein [Thermoanaerobaculia bacterium]